MRQNCVVPVTMELGSFNLKGLHLSITDFDARRILTSIQGSLDTQSLSSCCGAKEADDHLPALQGLTTPVGGDMAEHTVLNLVPLARARGQVADTDAQAALIGEVLQFPLPQPRAGAVAPAAVSGDQQFRGLRIQGRAHLEPPGADRRYGEGCCVMIHADADPADVGVQVIDTLRDRLA